MVKEMVKNSQEEGKKGNYVAGGVFRCSQVSDRRKVRTDRYREAGKKM